MSEINFQKFMTFLEYKISLKISKGDNQKLLIEVQTIQCNGQNKEKQCLQNTPQKTKDQEL